MKTFKQFIKEADTEEGGGTEGVPASIDAFRERIASCLTIKGLDELEKYYNKRSKELNIKELDDITIRDAIDGRREEIAVEEEEEVGEEVGEDI